MTAAAELRNKAEEVRRETREKSEGEKDLKVQQRVREEKRKDDDGKTKRWRPLPRTDTGSPGPSFACSAWDASCRGTFSSQVSDEKAAHLGLLHVL